MKAAVTGATGFIGSALVEYLQSQQIVDTILPCSRNDESAFTRKSDGTWVKSQPHTAESYFKIDKPDVVFHCAGNPNTDSPTSFSDNVSLTEKYLNWCSRGTKFIFMSSASIYGSSIIKDIRFEEFHEMRPTSMYAASKAASELAILAAACLGRINPVILRLGAVVGPGMTHGAVKAIFQKINDANEGDEITVYGHFPGAEKPYIHVNDVCEIATRIAFKNNSWNIYNVAPDDNLSIDRIVDICKFECKKNVKLNWVGDAWLGDNHYVRLGNDRLQKELRSKPQPSELAVKQAVREMQ